MRAIESQQGNVGNFGKQHFHVALQFPPSLCVIILWVKSLLRILQYLQVHVWRMPKISLPHFWLIGCSTITVCVRMAGDGVGSWGQDLEFAVTTSCPGENWRNHWTPELTREEVQSYQSILPYDCPLFLYPFPQPRSHSKMAH